MHAARVSILIPCYNAARTVCRAVDSALAQTCRDIEVVVADDGSTDESLTLLRRYEHDPRVAVHPEPHRGGNATRNRLIELAGGEYVQFLDADDELDPTKIEACLAEFQPAVDVVYTNHRVRTGGMVTNTCLPAPSRDMVSYLVANNVAIHEPLHRRAALREAGGFDESLPCCQEFELHLRLARRHWRGVRHVPAALCTVHVTAGSVSSNKARIFSTKARVLSSLAEDLRADGSLDRPRAEAISEEMQHCVRQLCFAGLDAEAAAVYAAARALAPSARYPAKWPLRLAVRVLGPVAAERLRTRGLRCIGPR